MPLPLPFSRGVPPAEPHNAAEPVQFLRRLNSPGRRHVTLAGFIDDTGADATGRAHLISALVARSKELHSKGDNAGCVAQLQRCLTVAQDGDLREEQGMALKGLGVAFERQKDYRKALKHYEEFKKIAIDTEDTAAQAEAYSALAKVYQARLAAVCGPPACPEHHALLTASWRPAR